MRAVNLLPRDLEQVKRGPSKPVIVACVGAVVATAALAGGFLNASSAVGKKNAALASAQARLAAIPPPPPTPAVVAAIPQERQARVAAVSTALASRVAWDRVLREISLVLPDDVWLTQLSGQVPAGTIADAGQGMRLTGYTYSQESVARLLARLTVVPDLTAVTLTNAAQNDLGKRTIVQFDIVASLNTSAAAPASS
jgi:Tfp pilus assembly protein PilN